MAHDRHLATVLQRSDTFLWKNGRNRPNTTHEESSQASPRLYQYDQRRASCLRQVQTSPVGTLADNSVDTTGGSNVVLPPPLNVCVRPSRLTPIGVFEAPKYREYLRKDSRSKRSGLELLLTQRTTKDVHGTALTARSRPEPAESML